MYFVFSLKYISAIFMRSTTLGEPPVPSLCGLFKMGLTDTQFFLYISYDKDIECVYRKFQIPAQPWEKIFYLAHQCRDAFT